MCHETEEWCKMWGGTDLFFEKWYEKSDKFWSYFLKSENFHFNGLLLIKVHNDWITGKLCVITLKNDTKFEKELTCPLKNVMKNFVNFYPTLESLKICILMDSFWSKYIIFELKYYRRVMCHDTDRWCIISRNIGWWFKKWHKEFD